MPAWRHFQPWYSEEPELTVFGLVDLVLGLASAVVTGVILPLLTVAVEMPVAAIRPLVSDRSWVEASAAEPRPSRLTWRTDKVHAAAVVDQVARQLELGYARVEPHNAVFEGFADM